MAVSGALGAGVHARTRAHFATTRSVTVSTRPDDEPDDKRPAPDESSPSSREDRVRGGFFQSDETDAAGSSGVGAETALGLGVLSLMGL